MAFGTIKWFNHSKGYGFITPEQGGKDVFLHISALQKSGINSQIHEGQRIYFETETGRDGKISAAKIRLEDA